MKMKVIDSYAGPAGVFAGDQVLDLPECDIARLQKAGLKLRSAEPDHQVFAVDSRRRNIRLQKESPAPKTKPVKSSPKTK